MLCFGNLSLRQILSTRSSLAGIAAALYLAQCLNAAQKAHNTEACKNGQCLEKGPLQVVEKKRSLKSDNRATEEGMGDGCLFESLR